MTKKKLNTKKSKQAAWIEAFKSTLFNITKACQKVGINRSTFYRWLDDPTFEQQVQEAREEKLDYIENALLKKISQGDTASIIFGLKTLGKSRGYIERKEISGPDGSRLNPIDVKVLLQKPDVRIALETIARVIDENGNTKAIERN